jgi:hypothetical protein
VVRNPIATTTIELLVDGGGEMIVVRDEKKAENFLDYNEKFFCCFLGKLVMSVLRGFSFGKV